MKKFISTFSILLLILIFGFVSSTSVSANSIIPPEGEIGYSSVDSMPFPTNSLLGTPTLLRTAVATGSWENGQLYRIFRYEMPIYCLIGLENGGDYNQYTAGSTQSLTYTESIAINITHSEQVSNMHSLSLSSSLGTKLGFAGVSLEASVSAGVSEAVEQTYGNMFSYTTTEGVSYTSNYNIIVSGKYRLEKRAFLYVYVIQAYTAVSPTGLGSSNPRVRREITYYFNGNSIKLGLPEGGGYEIGLSKYDFIDGKYVFDKDYYVNTFNNGDSNFLVL